MLPPSDGTDLKVEQALLDLNDLKTEMYQKEKSEGDHAMRRTV